LKGGRFLDGHEIGIKERRKRARRNIAGKLRVLPNLTADRLRRQSECTYECPPHSFAIRKAREPRDRLDGMPAVFQHQPGGLETELLDGLCR
jgi:hypothetical protein